MRVLCLAATFAPWGIGCLGTGTGGGGDGDTDIDADTDVDTDADSDSDGDCPPAGVATQLPLGPPVALASATDLDGDGRMDLLVSSGDGVASFVSSGCGALGAAASVLAGTSITGLTHLGEGMAAAFDDSMTLHALSGADLGAGWSDPVAGLSSPGAVLAAHLDTDGDRDVAAFDATYGNLLRVENTGSGWSVRTQVALPAGISNVAAGDLGGNARDEILFLGGGLVEVVSVADFDFSDVRPLTFDAHAAAAFADFNGDGNGDVMVAAGSGVELWTSDGATNITLVDSTSLGGSVLDVATVDRGSGPEVAALVAGGGVRILDGTFAETGSAETAADASRIFGGDVDGDARDDVVVVTDAGSAWVWRTL